MRALITREIMRSKDAQCNMNVFKTTTFVVLSPGKTMRASFRRSILTKGVISEEYTVYACQNISLTIQGHERLYLVAKYFYLLIGK